MPSVLPSVLIAAALVLAAIVVVPLVRNRPAGRLILLLLTALEIGLLVLAVLGIVNLTDTEREVDGATFVGYLIGTLAVVPAAVAWARAERSRWGNGVLIVGLLLIPVLIVRLNQIWSAHA